MYMISKLRKLGTSMTPMWLNYLKYSNKMKKSKPRYFGKPRYVIAFTTNHPTKYTHDEEVVEYYVLDMDVYTTHWTSTCKKTEARSYNIDDASIVCMVLNKINKCYFRIVPIFEMQIFESKLNTFPDEL